MDKIFNWFSFCFGAIGGILASLLGGIDEILIALLLLCVFDFISGIIKSIITKKLSSEVGFKGILKKVGIFIVVAISCILQTKIFGGIPLREVTIFFYIANEGISILENLSEIVDIPQKVKDVLYQLRNNKK